MFVCLLLECRLGISSVVIAAPNIDMIALVIQWMWTATCENASLTHAQFFNWTKLTENYSKLCQAPHNASFLVTGPLYNSLCQYVRTAMGEIWISLLPFKIDSCNFKWIFLWRMRILSINCFPVFSSIILQTKQILGF